MPEASAANPAVFVVAGPLRLLIALILVAIATLLIQVGSGLDWGMAWVLWVPAATLIPIALSLGRRVVLRHHDGTLEVETGWLFRRGHRLTLDGCALEVLPTAGFHAVILHCGGRELALATWLSRRRAEALLAWLDVIGPAGGWPRRQRASPPADR